MERRARDDGDEYPVSDWFFQPRPSPGAGLKTPVSGLLQERCDLCGDCFGCVFETVVANIGQPAYRLRHDPFHSAKLLRRDGFKPLGPT
jgi:hypothetical protein